MSRVLANLRLRTKFLFSLVLVTTGLTCAALLVVRHTARVQMQREIEEDAHNAILTFQVVQRQHQIELSHTADLLATLAHIRNGDASAIQDSSGDPWQPDNCNLFALADGRGKIVALHTTVPGFPVATAEVMLRRSLRGRRTAGWWYGGGRLYQVALQPLYDGGSPSTPVGTVVVGREIGIREASDLRGISSTQVLFRDGGEVAVSTLSSLQEQQVTQQLEGGAESKRIRIDDESFWADSVELTLGDSPTVTLTVLKSYDGAKVFLSRLNHLLLGLGLIAVLVGAVLVFVISDAFTRPLASLAEGVRALEQGDFAYPLEPDGEDEVAQVTRTFDRMRRSLQSNEARKQELEAQLRQAHRMEAMGRLAGGVAHDFNNLLTIVKGHSDLLLSGLEAADPLYRSGQQIAKAADRAASLTRQLLAFSRMQVLQPKVLDLNALVADMGKLLTRLIREDIAFTFRPGEPLSPVKADPSQIEQVILNLTVNACDAMPRGGKLNIETRDVTVDAQAAQTRPPMPPGEYVLLSVTDTGQGMDAGTKARIFEPFFTTKELGKGTGLGLATVYGVVKQSGGYIWVDSEPEKGTRFEIYLPRTDEPMESPPSPGIATGLTRKHETVLIAEDEVVVRELASEFLKSVGYAVLTAADGTEALAVANKWDAPIHVLLTDVVMPNMRGPELAKRLKLLRPDIKIVYMSGYSEYDSGNGEFIADSRFLQKPYSRETLLSKIREALGKRQKKSVSGSENPLKSPPVNH
jgi:signal transduction histidine kinase/ActR/RegA family two-component response regulator